jgi:hypothetical protein
VLVLKVPGIGEKFQTKLALWFLKIVPSHLITGKEYKVARSETLVPANYKNLIQTPTLPKMRVNLFCVSVL